MEQQGLAWGSHSQAGEKLRMRASVLLQSLLNLRQAGRGAVQLAQVRQRRLLPIQLACQALNVGQPCAAGNKGLVSCGCWVCMGVGGQLGWGYSCSTQCRAADQQRHLAR